MARMWDPLEVQLTVSGTVNNQDGVVTGFAEDSMIRTEKNEDNIIPYVGIRGDATIAKNADDSGTITVNLAHNSPWVYKFARIAGAKEAFKVSVTNRNLGGLGLRSTDGFVIKSPDTVVNKEVEEVEVQIWIENYNVE